MRIFITFAMAEALLVPGCILKVGRNIVLLLLLDKVEGIIVCIGCVCLLTGCEVEGRVGQEELPLGHSNTVKGLCAGDHNSKRIGVCHSNILGGLDHKAPEDELGILAPSYHPGHPVEGSIGVASS